MTINEEPIKSQSIFFFIRANNFLYQLYLYEPGTITETILSYKVTETRLALQLNYNSNNQRIDNALILVEDNLSIDMNNLL